MQYNNECMACKYKWMSLLRATICPTCSGSSVFSKAESVNTPRVIPTYGTTQPTVAEPSPEKVDQRKVPPQYGMDRALATGCACDGSYKHCKYGRKSPYDEGCTYHRFGIMCDKVVTSDGKEIN